MTAVSSPVSLEPDSHISPDPMEFLHVSDSPEQTRAIAATLVNQLPDRAVVALHGDLGAGKTCFVKGMALALGIQEAVTSPTYTLIHEYQAPRPLFHADLYRLADEADTSSIGLEEYLDMPRGITAIEWPERAGNLIPADAVHVTLELGDQHYQRRIRIVRP